MRGAKILNVRWRVMAALSLLLPAGAGAGPVLSDSNLFAALNLNYPGLAAVKTNVLQLDYAAAKTNLAAYLRARTNVTWFWDPHLVATNVSYVKSNADNTVAAKITVVGITWQFANSNIDWWFNPTDYPTNGYLQNNEWQWQLNRQDFWPNLGDTYWGTRNELYAQTWVAQLRDWLTSCPAATGASNGYPSAWRTLDAAGRMSDRWPNTYHRFLLSPSVTDNDLVDYLKSVVEQGRYVRKYFSTNDAPNVLVAELTGFYVPGALYPELNEAAEWRTNAAALLYREQARQYYPDGAQNELTSGYQGASLDNLVLAYQVGALEGRLGEFAADYAAGLEKDYAYYLWLMAPDRYLPQFNDCINAANAVSFLTDGFALFTNRADFQWVSSRGASGAPPAQVSISFPWAGYNVMRSSWATNANYLCLDAGPLGSSKHRHQDKLNVVLWAYGREVLFDSGGGAYGDTVWHNYGQSTYSHNTVLVDNLGQQGGDGTVTDTDPDYISQGPIPMRWESDSQHDFAAGTFSRGYGTYTNRPATHTRRVLFVKPDLYLVADTLVGNYGTNHTYEARWHLLTTNWTTDPVTKVVTTTDANKPNLAIIPCLLSNLTVSAVSCVSNGPDISQVIGWDLSGSQPINRPALTARHLLTGAGSQQFLTLLCPLAAGVTNPVTQIVSTGPNAADVWLSDGRRLKVFADPDPARGLKVTEVLANNSTNRNIVAGYGAPFAFGFTNLAFTVNPGPVAIPFTVSDSAWPASNLTVTAVSSNVVLLPNAGLALSGTDTNRILTITPAANLTGTGTIAVTVTDPDGSANVVQFDVAVSGVYYWDTAAGSGLQAGDGTWSAANNSWAPTNAGAASLFPWPAAGAQAMFIGAGGSYAINVAGTQNIDDLTCTNGTYTFNGGVLCHATGLLSLRTDGNVTLNSALVADTGLTKLGQGVLTLGCVPTFAGDFAVAAGTLRPASDYSLAATNGLTLGSGATGGSLDLTKANLSVARLIMASTNATATNYVTLGAGKTLCVNGPLLVGFDGSNVTTRAVIGGPSAAMAVTNLGGVMQIGLSTGAVNGNVASLDLSSLGAFSLELGVNGVLRVGDTNSGIVAGGASTLMLAATNVISASTLSIGASGRVATQTLKLGSVGNVICADNVNVSTGIRETGIITFQTNTGSLRLRGRVGGESRANLSLGTGGATTGATASPTVNLLGHEADLLLDRLAIGDQPRGGTLTNTFSMDQGVLDANAVVMAQRINTNVNNYSTLNLGGGIVRIGSGGLIVASNAVGIVNLTGGQIACSNAIIKTGTGTARLTLNGAALDLTGHAIGSASLPLDTLSFQAGTLRNVAEINGGADWIKGSTNLLALEGTNTYTGRTWVTNGTLAISGVLSNASQLLVTNRATLLLSNAQLCVSLLRIGSNASVVGSGSIGGVVVNEGAIYGGNGPQNPLVITGALTNYGTIRLTNGTPLVVAGTLVNYGLVDLITGSGILPANLVNYGQLLDRNNVVITNAVISGTNVFIQVFSYGGHNYQLMRADSVKGNLWTNASAQQPGADAPLTLPDPGGGKQRQRFYRIRVQP